MFYFAKAASSHIYYVRACARNLLGVCVSFICEAGLYYCLSILQVCGTHATRIETWDTRGIDGVLTAAASYLLTSNYDETIMQLE